MTRVVRLLLAVLAVAMPLTAQAAPRRDAQGEVRKDMREGKVNSLRDIERRVLPSMPGMQYLDPNTIRRRWPIGSSSSATAAWCSSTSMRAVA